MFWQLLFTVLLSKASVGIVYDSYTGEPASDELIAYFKEKNILENCTNDIQLPCDMSEGRRMDGSCNNPNFPASGTYHTPLYRFLSSVYSEGDSPRLSVSGNELPLERPLRKRSLHDGKAVDPEFTQFLTHTAAITFADSGSVHDSMNYIRDKLYCCQEEGKNDHMCTPIEVPADDSTHRFSGIRCLNLTRPQSFQSYGCAAATQQDVLSRIEFNTPLYDLSFLYRPTVPAPENRAKTGGLLLVDEEDGSIWPPSAGPLNTTCFNNVASAGEDKCFGVVNPSILAVNLVVVMYYRLHNIVAKELAALNPHWDDDKLFYTTRDILIAFNNQFNYYELMPELLGRENALKSGLISDSDGFRDLYDETINPQASLDFMYAMRWFHTVQDSSIKLHDENNVFTKEIPAVNLTLRVGYFRKDDNYAGILRNGFLKPCGKLDNLVDADLSEMGFGGIQRSTDLTTADLRKGRLFGIRPYVDYLEKCGAKKPETWKDMEAHQTKETIELWQEVYEDVLDVDLLAGIWGEKSVKGGFVTPTVACILNDQMQRAMRADRHWYERKDRPNAFTYEQLQEIRKFSLANFVCTAEDKIKTIQPRPLRRISESNPLMRCEDIPKWNLSAWKEDPSSSTTTTSSRCRRYAH